jgi:hypothetical protein
MRYRWSARWRRPAADGHDHRDPGVPLRFKGQAGAQAGEANRCKGREPGQQVGRFPPQPVVILVQQGQQDWEGGLYGPVGGQRPLRILRLGPAGGVAQPIEGDDAIGQDGLLVPDRRIRQQVDQPGPVVGVGRGGQLDQEWDGRGGRRVPGALVDDRGEQFAQGFLADLGVG